MPLFGSSVPKELAGTDVFAIHSESAISWQAGRAFRHGGQIDALIGIFGWTDASGSASGPLTYTRGATFEITKTGHGNVDAYHGLVTLTGDGEAGLFIGQCVTTNGHGWGGHFKVTNNTTAAEMFGHIVEIERNVTGATAARGIEVQSTGTQRATTGLSVNGAGGWTNYLQALDAAGAQMFLVTGNSQGAGSTQLTTKTVTLGVAQTLKVIGDADLPRVYGGGSATGILFYGGQGGTLTSGIFRFRNNDADDTERFSINTGTPASGATPIVMRYHNGSAEQQGAVTVGAADSGGAGYRALRVPN